MERGAESFRTFTQYYVNKVTVYPYHVEIELNKGLEISEANSIAEYEMFAAGFRSGAKLMLEMLRHD